MDWGGKFNVGRGSSARSEKANSYPSCRQKGQIKDVYRWAKAFIEGNYNRNEALINAYKSGKTLAGDPATAALGKAVLKDIGQNMADFLAFIDGRIDYKKAYEELEKQSAS